jgi:ribosomal protein S17
VIAIDPWTITTVQGVGFSSPKTRVVSIELNILEAAENIEKYQKETKTLRDRKIVSKDIKVGDLVLKRKKN